jgi:hypothetical protein
LFLLSLSSCSFWFDSRCSGLGNIIQYPPFCLTMLLASYVLYVCVILSAKLSCWWASVRMVHPRIWFKPPVAISFSTDRSKAVTTRVLTFVICLWPLFWNWSLHNHALFSSLLLHYVWEGCVCWMWPFLICLFHFFKDWRYINQLYHHRLRRRGHCCHRRYYHHYRHFRYQQIYFYVCR